MDKREPQVGDVYGFNSLIAVVIPGCAVSIKRNIGHVQNIMKCLNIGNCYFVGYDKDIREQREYKGKLAPRYKRLFGIYYIPDNNG